MEARQSFDTHANSKDRSVVVLKTSDVKIRGNSVFMPITIEMSQIKKPERGQFKKVEITKQMTERDVKEKLLATFPCLRNERFYCAAAVDNRTRLDFNGDRRIWDGRLIRRLLKGNSALYIFVDEQVPGNANMAPHSGASSRTEDAILVSSSHSLPIGSSVYSQESRFSTQPAQSTFCASSDSSSPVQLTTKRPPEQMTTAENELSNQTFKKLRATKGVSNDTERNVAGDLNAGTPLRALGTAKVQVIQTMEADAHGVHQGYRRETDEGAERISGGVSSEHKASRECQSFGTAAEERSLAVYAKGTNSRERCVTSVIERHQEGLETPGSDSESQLSDSSAPRPTDSGNETSASLAVSDANLRLQVFIDPPRVPFWKGGTFICFDFESTLPSHIQSGSAEIGNLKTVELHRLGNSLIGREIPARDNPGLEHITLRADSGETLGNTVIEYYDDIEESIDIVVKNKILHPRFFLKMAVETDAQNSESGGSNQPFETLKGAVCVAAKRGAMQFIKTVFSSKAGRAICKENPLLPQLIAREHGYEEIANYLEKMTTKFSKEAKDIAEEFHEIDWKELITLAEAAIEKEEWSIAPDNRTHPVENDGFESGYMGDTETSSSEMSPLPSSDSESDDSEEGFGGSTDTLSSTTSSEASENYSPRTKVFRRTKVIHNVNVANISGNFAYASRSAKIQVPRGENSVNATSPQTETLTGVGDAEYDREQTHGSYCVYRRHSEPLFEDESAPWKARARKGIVINKRDEEFEWSIESFFQDLDLFIQEINKTGDIVKKQRERFILEVVLPHLETSWDKSVSGKGEVYKNLAKISRSVNSGNVVKNSLNLLLHLICRDNFDRGAESLLIVEKVMRSSIFSQNGMFKNDEHGEQNLKLFVYSRVLSLLLLQQERAVTLPIDDLKKVQEVIKQRRKEVKKKDRFRYSLEIIINTISYLLKQHNNTITGTIVKGLEECQQFCKNSNTEERNLQILQTLGSGVDLHYILIHLYGKVHSERPVPQLESERLAMKLIRLIVEDYFNRDGGAQERWKFCLLASSILADITQNNVTKELRTEAGGCLANILRNEKVQKKPECRLLVEQMCSEVFFCPDNETRTFLLHFSNKNKNLEDSLPADQQTKQLCLAYRTQRLEINGTTISKKTDSFVNHGEFQGKKVAIKVLNVKKKHLLEDNPKFEARERLIQEAYNMRRLNASKHSNFPVVLAYDTQSLPYHLITEFERYGNLLKFVQNAREDHRLTLRSNQLLLMLKDITDALLHLEKLGLVHRATMAENVLVGDNYVCKLSGLHAMKKLTGLDTLDDYCSADLPDFISSSNDDDLPIRWKAPECLTRGCYSTASDVWAFGVLAYEVLTFGCTPYRNLSKDEDVRNRVVEFKEIVQREDCFQDKEFELIKQCCKWQMTKRLKLSKVRERLEEMIHLTGNIEARSYLPPLGMQQVARESSDSDWEEIYDFITDVSEDFRDYDSMSFDEINDTHETFAADPGKEYIQGFNRLVPEHVEHVEKLRSLKHFNLAPVLEVMRHDSLEGPSCNLKEYVLNRRCNPKDIVTYLSQVASALHYLHFNHILHGDLRAQHVDVIEPNKVKVGHLDRSKYLSMNAYEATSTTCVVEDTPPTDAIRWSAPEVISDGRFTHASDVWAFGVLAWELYESFRTGQENRELSVPYYSLDNNEILHHMTDKGPMKQPECCPDWVYILMHQCWAFESVQRPPFLAIFDCLTSREPMKSWMMKCWLQTHCESEWPDLNVCQKEDSSHVLPETLHPSPKNIEKMCSDEYFGKHTYRYDETVKGYVEENESLYTYARCEVTANSLEDISGYLCPKESCVDAFKSKKRQSESGEAFNFLKTKRGTVSSKSRKAEDDIQEDREYENMQQNEKTIPYDPPPDKEHWDYQNMPLNVAQNHEYESMEQHHGFSRDFPRQYDQEDKENKDCQAPTALEDDPPTIDKRKRNAPCFKAKRLFKWQPEQKEHVYENRNTFNHVTAQLGAF